MLKPTRQLYTKQPQKNKMSKFGIIGLIAVLMAIAGIIIQTAYDDRGFYLTVGAVVLVIIRQVTKSGKRKIN